MEEFLFTILVIWLLFRILGRFSVRQTFNPFQQQEEQYRETARRKEGEVHIDYVPEDTHKKKVDDKLEGLGEYVDYEEVK